MSFNKKTKKYEGYLYCITNLVNGKKYIGQTTQTIERRFKQHIECAKPSIFDNHMLLPKAIHKYGEENFSITLLCMEIANSKNELIDKLNDLETEYIKKYNTTDKNLGYNLTAGGNTVTENSMTPVDKYSENGLFLGSYESAVEGCRQSGIDEDGYRNILRCCKGTRRTAYGFIWRYKGEPFDKYRVEKIIDLRKEPIDVYDVAGNYICTFDDIYDPIGVLENINYKQQIRDCCKGLVSCYSRYVFRFKGEPFDKYPVLASYKNKKVYCYTLDDEFVSIYDTATIAAMTTSPENIKRGRINISRCAKGDRKSAYGYKWYYEYNNPHLITNYQEETKAS